ncbi:MAG: CAP domain-containing protein, partial [Chloroflexi bacterium]|nr:CAP domain-containing protein [Chloroflexota bacterium]
QALDQVAGLRAEDMLVRGYVGPIGPGDASVPAQDLMGAAGYRGRLGELTYKFVGAPESLVDASVTAWMASEAHRALLLDTVYTYVGVGLIGDGERWIVALVFAEQGP